MSERLEIQAVPGGEKVTTLRVHGRLDARSGAPLLARCEEARKDGRHVVLNFADVPFIASSGVGVLLVLVEEFRQTRQQLRIAPASPAVESVIRLLNLQEFLVLRATEDGARTELEAA